MKTIIHLELEIEVDYDVQKAERMTRHYPGCPAAIEINTLSLDGIKLPINLENVITSQFYDEIKEACWDEVREDAMERAVCEAEYRRDAMENR